VKISVSKSAFSVIAMTVLWLGLLSIFLLCVNLVEIVHICYVLMSWILSVSRSEFYILCCIIKLIFGPINFLTICDILVLGGW
jgi:hypothetical protein